MMNRRFSKLSALLGAGLLAFGLGGTAKAQDAELEGAVNLVRLFFADHSARFNNGSEPLLNDAEASKKYLVDELAIDGLQGRLGADPVFCAQDAQIADLQIMSDPEMPMFRGSAQVRVNFTNFGQPVSTLYSLVQMQADAPWQISDIYCEQDNWSLVQAMRAQNIPYAPNYGEEVTWHTSDASPVNDQHNDAASDAENGMEQGDLPGNGMPGEGSDILFILDGSGSMWGQIDGVAKITTAKSALKGLIADLPSTTRAGLMAYGHRREGDCADTEVVMRVADHADGLMGPAIDRITPRGKTPISGALREALGAFPDPERRASVLLISDGLETCGGDPCAAAAELANMGIDTRVHVVGFDLNAQETEALQCIAENGNGNYYSAGNATEFVDAIEDALADMEATIEPQPTPTPEPEQPQLVKYFEEPFDGPSLNPVWQVENEIAQTKAFTGEGELFVSAFGRSNRYESADAQNRFILDKELPQGDFDLSLQTRFAVQTGDEHVWLSLYENANNQIGALLWADWKGCGKGLNLSLIKLSGAEGEKPEKVQFRSALFDGPVVDGICGRAKRAEADRILEHFTEHGALVKLQRRGRTLTASIAMEVPEMEGRPAQTITVESEAITALRLSGHASVFAGQWPGGDPGESHFLIDHFEIDQLQ